MNTKEFSLMQKLIDYASSSNLDHTSGILAYYLLLNYSKLEKLTLKIVTEECFVSVSSVRRFCRKLGYDNFSDLVKAKIHNPENQQSIALSNLDHGWYHPHILRTEINDTMYSILRTIPSSLIHQIANDILNADAVLLFCARPYSLWLREFQSQLIAWSKSVYILEEIKLYYPTIKQLGTNLCNIIVSPMAFIVEPLAQDFISIPGIKALVTSLSVLQNASFEKYLQYFDRIFPLKFKTNHYDYLEIYGKYAVGYLFDIILGEVIKLVRENRSSIVPSIKKPFADRSLKRQHITEKTVSEA